LLFTDSGKIVDTYFKQYSWQRDALISGGAVLAFAFIGPFGTFDDMLFFVRLLFWAIAIFGCGVFFWLVVYLLNKVIFLKKLHFIVRHIIVVFITAFPASVLIYYDNMILRDNIFPVARLPWLWLTVFVIGMIITGLNFFSHLGKSLSSKERHKREVTKIHIKTDKDILCFLDRLPKEIGSDLISLSMHDHYIDVTTKQGSALVHLKFSDAMKELKKYPGAQIHRSHWVVFSAIKNVKTNGRLKFALLSDGRELPISKTYKKVIETV